LIEKIAAAKKKDNAFLTTSQSSKGLAHKPSYSTLEKANKNADDVVQSKVRQMIGPTPKNGTKPVEVDFSRLNKEQASVIN
jgi:hypothetical protein